MDKHEFGDDADPAADLARLFAAPPTDIDVPSGVPAWVARVIDRYQTRLEAPPQVKKAAETFAKKVVTELRPDKDNRAYDLLVATTRLAIWCQQAGVPLDAKHVFRERTYERFLNEGMPDSPPRTIATYRANLRFIGERLVPAHQTPPARKVRRQKAAGPYTPSDIDAFLHLAEAQATPLRRHQLKGLICSIAGAGLASSDLRYVRGNHVRRHGAAVVVHVQGSRPRIVPVYQPYAEILLDAALHIGGDLLLGGVDLDRKNVTSNLLGRIDGGAHLPPLNAKRLRSTWLARATRTATLPGLQAATGTTSSQYLFDIAAELPRPSIDELIVQLGVLDS